MKNTLPFLLLVLVALGCSKFGPKSTSTSNLANTNANANAAPVKIAKIVDLPGTFGKTKDQIKSMISATPTSEDPWLEYDLPEASLTFMFNKGKANHSSFRFKPVSFGDASISGTDTAEQLATMAGIDIKGKTPTSTLSIADSYEQEIGGKKANIAIYHAGGKFNSIIITSN